MDEKCSQDTLQFFGNFLVHNACHMHVHVTHMHVRTCYDVYMLHVHSYTCTLMQDQISMDSDQCKFLLEFYSAQLSTLIEVSLGGVSWGVSWGYVLGCALGVCPGVCPGGVSWGLALSFPFRCSHRRHSIRQMRSGRSHGPMVSDMPPFVDLLTFLF